MTPILRRTAVLACLALAGLQPVAAQADPSCTLDPATHQLTATLDPADTHAILWLHPDGPAMAIMLEAYDGQEWWDLTCDGATTTSIDRIAVHGAANGLLELDASGNDQGFGPGLTPEPTGLSEIEIQVDGFAALLYHAPRNAPATLSAGTRGLSLNGDADVDVTYTGVSLIELTGSNTDDSISAQGGDGSGGKLQPAIEFEVATAGNGGDKTVLGHDGADIVYLDGASSADVSTFGGSDTLAGGTGPGPYLLDGGPGDDVLDSSGGGTTLVGGAGNDLFYLFGPGGIALGGNGDDQFNARNGGVDVIHGDGGNDTASADQSDHVTGVENVSRG
jgi:hypothetical protein